MIQNQTPAAPVASTPTASTTDVASAKANAAAAFAAGMAKLTGKGASEPQTAAPSAPAAATQEQPNGEQSPAGRNTDPTETRYERARRAILRTGVMKDDEFRKLDKQDAIRRGLKLERQQNRQAAAHAAAQDASQRKGQGSPPATAASASSNASAPAQNGLAELLDKLGLKDDAEARALLDSHLSPVMSENARLKAELEQKAAGERPDANQVKRVETQRQAITQSLGVDLQDDEDWNDVLEMAQRMSVHPKYEDALTNDATLNALLTEAVQHVLEVDAGERAKPAVPQGAAQRGLVETTGAREGVKVAADPRAAARAAFAAAMPDIARKYAGAF
jgi:hypothetical protein